MSQSKDCPQCGAHMQAEHSISATCSQCGAFVPAQHKGGAVYITEMKWTDIKGRTWEVVALHSPGVYTVRTTDRSRVGEMRAMDIKAAYLKGQLKSNA